MKNDMLLGKMPILKSAICISLRKCWHLLRLLLLPVVIDVYMLMSI